MTIAATTNRTSQDGNDVTTAFPFNYPFHAQADLVVISTVILTGVQTIKALTTHYTISGSTDAEGHYTNGGTVNFITAPASTERITIYRDPAITQSVDLTENDPLPVGSGVESPADRLTMIAQRLSDRLNRSLRQPEGDAADMDLLPAKVTRASKYMAFDADGDPVATAGTSSLEVISTFMATVLDDLTAAAARTTLDAQQLTESLPALTVPASGDSLPLYDLSGSSSSKITLDDLLKFLHTSKVAEGRLTLTTAVPVTTTDVTAATTLYYTPYKGDKISLYDGTSWLIRTFAELSIAIPATTNQLYDVFAYDNAGTVTLELLAWTNDTTRATALVRQNGVLCKTGALTRRFLGCMRTTGVAGQTEDSKALRYVWNHYHRALRHLAIFEATDSWTYSTADWRQANNAATNQVAFVIGVSEDTVVGRARSTVVSSGATSRVANVGIGVDSTTAFSGLPGVADCDNTKRSSANALYSGYPGVGRHYLAWLEYGAGTDTQTWYGDQGTPLSQQSGLLAEIWG